MKKFNEQAGSVVFTFGRFNPPTTGHEKLLDKVKMVAGSSRFLIFPSQSQNPKKDPLPYALKIAYMRKMFPKYAKNIIADKKVFTAFDIVVKLYNEKYTDVAMVVGSDRVKEFKSLLDKYNGVSGKRHGYYEFRTISVISAGERDPDAEGVAGMSASKMRAAATMGDFDSFKTGLPSGFRDGLKLYNDVRKYMGIREERDMGDMNDFETLRDLYLTGKIWNVGDIVESNGIKGKVIRKGTNYLSFVDEDNKVHKAWLYDIVERNYAQEYERYQGTPEQIARRSSRNKARRVMGDKVVKGMDVGHKDNNPMNNDPSNLKNEDPSDNRREPRLRERNTKQDKDIKDRPGTQPAKYYAKDTEGDAMAKSTKQARARHFAKKKKGPAPGDASATTKPSKHTQKFKQMYGEARAKQAVSQGKVQKLVTAHGLKFKGKVHKEIDMELKKINNSTEMVTFKIIHPKELFGNETNISFKALRRGPFMATDTSKINEKLGKDADMGDYIDDFKKSDAPQFKGKSKEKRKDMAIAAYLDKKDKKENQQVDEALSMTVRGKGKEKYRLGYDQKFTLNGKGYVSTGVTKQQVYVAKGPEGEKVFSKKELEQLVKKGDIKFTDMGPINQEEVDMDIYHLDEKITALVNKAKKTGMPYGILKKVYDRGMAAYKTGHRPGATPQQWALARVNSFTTKSSGTWGKADKDLADKVRASEEVKVQETELGMIPKKKRKGHEVLGPESVNEWFESNMTRASYQLRHGDDWWWKLNEVHDAMLEKIGADCCDDCGEELDEAMLIGRDYEYDEKEGVVKISKKNFAKVKKDSKGSDPKKPMMMVLTKKGTSLVPVKFTEEVKLDEQPEHEITVGNYTTKFFYMCGSAQKVMDANKTTIGAESLTRLQDDFYKLEKQVMDAGEATNEQKVMAKELYNQIMMQAGKVGLADEIDAYMKQHIDSIEKGDPKPGFGRTDIDESLWANIHKKRQRIKRGSGERMRKKGEKGAPTAAQMKRAKSEEMLNWVEGVLKRDKKFPNLFIKKKGAAGKTKFDRAKLMRSPDRKLSDYQMMMKNSWGEVTEKAEYDGKSVELNNPTRGDVKKYKVYVKNDKGNVVKVEFGDPNMEIKRDDPARRKSFRARHNCDNPGPKYKARYWSCKFWSAKSVTDLMKG